MVAASLLLAASGKTPDAKPDLSKDPTLYIVGYAHLDTQWRWTFPQTIGEFLPKTMHDNFKLFEQYPSYVFNFTGSNRYRLMKEYWPEDYATLKDYVKKGRWFPAGSSVEEGDVNSPSLESLVRQVLYGNEFFDKEFGTHSDEYMLPDCFGFPAALPSVLAHCGVKGFSTQKLTWGSAVGIPFNVGVWEGCPDGKSVVAALNPGSYGGSIDNDASNDQSWIKRVNEDGQKTGIFADYKYYGTGDTGGSPSPDSVKWAETSLHGTGPLKIVGGRADQLFNDLTPGDVAKLPRYKGDLELTQHSAGSLTSESEHKKWNHENEKLAQAAEEASVAANLVAHSPYPTDQLLNAWYLFLAGQFHDTMAGTALPRAYQFAWNDDCIALNEFQSATDAGTSALAQNLDTRGPGVAVVVFNPTSLQRHDLVQARVNLGSKASSYEVVAPSGERSPLQIVSRSGDMADVLFRADAGSVSWGVYHIVPSSHGARAEIASGHSLENEFLKVKVDEKGDVVSVIDKQSGRETLAGPIRLALMHENPDNWPAWNMDWADQQKPPYGYVDGPAKVSVVESGPVRGSIKVERSAHGSTFVQYIQLQAGSPRLEFHDSIDWKTKETALKQEFKLAASNPKAVYNWQVGTVTRANNDPKKYEVASHRWFDLTDTSGSFGASVLTGSKIGSDKPSDDTLRLTLLYSPGIHGGYQDQFSQDWGHHEISYAFFPHEGTWKTADTPKQAMEQDQPMVAFQTGEHDGSLGANFSLVSTNNPDVTVVAVKQAEDGDGLIVRVRENSGTSHKGVQIGFADAVISSTRVDGQERSIGAADVQDGKIVFDSGAYGVDAFRVSLKPYVAPETPAEAAVDLPYDTSVATQPGHLTSGSFDGQGRSLAGDQLPTSFNFKGVDFKLAPTSEGVKDAVACAGQTVAVPSGDWKSVHILAASSNGPQKVAFDLDGTGQTAKVTVDDWGGFYGQWDTRIWKGTVDAMAYDFTNALDGIEPGFLRNSQIAWNCSHRHDAKGNEIYQYSYLYDYELPAGKGLTAIKLPDNPAVKVLAISVSGSPVSLRESTKLTETFSSRVDAPVISPSSGKFKDSVLVTIEPGLYGKTDDINYSIDGGKLQKYDGPVLVSKANSITARVGNGPATTAHLEIDDRTPPSVKSAFDFKEIGRMIIDFSKPLDAATAGDPKHYVMPGADVTQVSLSPDGTSVWVYYQPNSGFTGDLKIQGVLDRSPRKNKVDIDLGVVSSTPLASIDDFVADGKSSLSKEVADLPVKASQPWTINFWVTFDEIPAPLTPIAGFGESRDGRNGASRYLCMFDRGLEFWGCNIDVASDAQFKPGVTAMVTATYDGSTIRVFKDGAKVAEQQATLEDAPAVFKLAPIDGWERKRRIKGEIKNFRIYPCDIGAVAVGKLFSTSSGSR